MCFVEGRGRGGGARGGARGGSTSRGKKPAARGGNTAATRGRKAGTNYAVPNKLRKFTGSQTNTVSAISITYDKFHSSHNNFWLTILGNGN